MHDAYQSSHKRRLTAKLIYKILATENRYQIIGVNMATLAELIPLQIARVCQLRVDADLGQRLAALGLRPDREIEVIRRGWLAGPIQVRVGATDFMLRQVDAQLIDVEILLTAEHAE